MKITTQISLLAVAMSSTVLASESLEDVCNDCVPEKVAECGGFLEGATVDDSNRLWVMDLTGDRILEITDAGQCVTRGSTGGQPNGAKFHPDGRLIIADNQLGMMSYNTDSEELVRMSDSYEGKPALPNDLAFDEDGGIFYSSPEGSSLLKPTGRVFYIPPGETEPTLYLDGLAYPNGVAVQPETGNLLVSEFAAQRIILVPGVKTPGMRLSHVYAHTRGGVGADGLMFDEDGRLFAANFGSAEVLVHDSNGVPLGAISLPEEAGLMLTNLVIRDDYLYLTEAEKGEVWRVKINR